MASQLDHSWNSGYIPVTPVVPHHLGPRNRTLEPHLVHVCIFVLRIIKASNILEGSGILQQVLSELPSSPWTSPNRNCVTFPPLRADGAPR